MPAGPLLAWGRTPRRRVSRTLNTCGARTTDHRQLPFRQIFEAYSG